MEAGEPLWGFERTMGSEHLTKFMCSPPCWHSIHVDKSCSSETQTMLMFLVFAEDKVPHRPAAGFRWGPHSSQEERAATRMVPPQGSCWCRTHPPPRRHQPPGRSLLTLEPHPPPFRRSSRGSPLMEASPGNVLAEVQLCQRPQRSGRHAAVRFGSFEAIHKAFDSLEAEDQVCNSAGTPANRPPAEKIKQSKTEPTRSAPPGYR